MGVLSTDLDDLGYQVTERESPFHDDGQLWKNSYEYVCDETGIVIRKDGSGDTRESDEDERHTYQNTGTVKLYGGYVRPYANSDGLY